MLIVYRYLLNRHLNTFQHLPNRLFLASPAQAAFASDDDPVREDGDRHLLDVLGDAVRPPPDQSESLRRALECNRPPRAHPELEHPGVSGFRYYRENIVQYGIVDPDPLGKFLEHYDFFL